MIRTVMMIQGVYFCATGIWPLVSMETFEAVTGEKTDDWLVQTVGVLAALIGFLLLVGVSRREVNRETVLLSIGSSLAFAGVDVVFYLQGVLSWVYLGDAGLQALALAGHLFGWIAQRQLNRAADRS